MKVIKLAIIGGIRPQFIKMAALKHEIIKYNNSIGDFIFEPSFINTQQHYDQELSKKVCEDLSLNFDHIIPQPQKKPIDILANTITHLYEYLSNNRHLIDWVVVLGDATTTMAAAIVAARLYIPIVHVEAGVRSGDLRSLEEQHRRIVGQLATIHFCSAESNVQNLQAEGITQDVYWVGDVGYDHFIYRAQEAEFAFEIEDNFILATIHKSTNFRDPHIIKTLVNVLSNYHRPVVFVMHPKTRHLLKELGVYNSPGITFIESLSYTQMLALLKRCAFLVTDSGGLQREAYLLGKRCLVRRETLGWSKLVELNFNRLIGIEADEIELGLEWVEKELYSDSLKETASRNIKEFYVPNAGQKALQILEAISTQRELFRAI